MHYKNAKLRLIKTDYLTTELKFCKNKCKKYTNRTIQV